MSASASCQRTEKILVDRRCPRPQRAAQAIITATHALASGTKLGPCEIPSPVGAGRMAKSIAASVANLVAFAEHGRTKRRRSAVKEQFVPSSVLTISGAFIHDAAFSMLFLVCNSSSSCGPINTQSRRNDSGNRASYGIQLG